MFYFPERTWLLFHRKAFYESQQEFSLKGNTETLRILKKSRIKSTITL